MRRRLEHLASKKGMRTCFFCDRGGFKGEVQERGAPASRSVCPGDILTAVIAGGVICAALVGGILLRGVVLLGGRLHALAVIAGIGGGAALGGALGIAFGVAHSLVVARCADQVGGGSPQGFTRLGVGINGSVGSAYRCGIQVKVGQVATFRLMASSTSTMVT